MSEKSSRTEKFKFPSSNNVNQIAAYIYYPETENVKGIIQISHGMCEYFENYKDFVKFFNDNGFIVCGNDHLGHGDSAENEQYGFFSETDGYIHVTDDVFKLTRIMKEKFKELPYFLFGHSMGSFIARNYALRHKNVLDGLIICGTAGKNPAVKLAKLFAKREIKKGNGKKPNKFLDNLAFSGYNKKIKNPVSKMDWLSTDTKVGQEYLKSKKRNFIFSSYAFYDLFNLLDTINQNEWFESVEKDLPILLVAGDSDPVGNYGKGVTQVFNRLKNAGIKDVSIRLFEGVRHEPHNDFKKQEFKQFVISWINKHITN